MTPWCPELNMCCTQPDQGPQVCVIYRDIVKQLHGGTIGVSRQENGKIGFFNTENILKISNLWSVNIL